MWARARALILDLDGHDGAAALVGVALQRAEQRAPPAGDVLQIARLGGAQAERAGRALALRQHPGRQAAGVPLRADVGPRAQQHQQPQLVRKVQELSGFWEEK